MPYKKNQQHQAKKQLIPAGAILVGGGIVTILFSRTGHHYSDYLSDDISLKEISHHGL